MELDSGGFPAAFGIGPATPLDEVVFNERVGSSHAADAFNTAVADGITAEDLRFAGLPRGTAVAVSANVKANAIGPLDGVVFEDPMIAAGK